MPPIRYFVYVFVTVNAVLAAIYAGWALAMDGPGLEVIIPVTVIVSGVSAWAVAREFSRPA